MISNAYYASSVIKISSKSLGTAAALREAAQVLNVAEPTNWGNLMESPSTTGSTGTAQVGSATLADTMATWPIPDEFRADAVQKVNLLVTVATEGSYTAQAFVFDTQTGGVLSTLIVVVQKLDSPNDPNLSIAVSYIVINSNAVIKQQYTSYNERSCHKCAKCLWTSACCCHDETKYAPRGNTPQETYSIKQKLTFDQFTWFNQQSLNRRKRNSSPKINLNEAIEKYLSNNIVKGEILASYNDSIISALQSNISLLKLSSQSLKLTKVTSQNILTILSTLSAEYGFEDLSRNNDTLQEIEFGRVSYENLFTDNSNNQIIMKYIWIVGQRLDNEFYSMNFLSINITSQILINILLSNTTDESENLNRKIQIIRISSLNDYGTFLNEYLPSLITPWEMKTTQLALNILRYTAASIIIPQRHRMLSYFDSLTTNSNAQSRTVDAKIVALSNAISAAAKAWKDVVSAIKSSSSTTITRIVRFGFTYFSQKSTAFKAIDIPADRANEFITALVIDYNLPSKGSFALGLTYSNDFAWDRIDYLYSPSMNGTYRSLTIFKNGDSIKNTASFFVVDIDAGWELAPDLLIIQTSKSYLGGLFESSKQSIQEVPHILTFDEATKLQQFFMIVAIHNLANSLGANITVPELN